MDRLRWDNIARAAGLLAVVALVVAWPHLKGAPPPLPPAAATPVSVQDPAVPAHAPRPAPAPPARPRAATPKPRPVRLRRPHRRGHVRVHRAPPRVAPSHAAPPPAPAPSRAAPAPSPSADDQAAREFAVP